MSYENQEHLRAAIYVRSSAPCADGAARVLAQLDSVPGTRMRLATRWSGRTSRPGEAGAEWVPVARLRDEAASSDRDFDVVVVWSFSRLTGDDAHRTSQLVAKQNGIERFAASLGCKTVCWYADTGTADPDRPALGLLMDDLDSGERDFGVLLVWSMSRLSRKSPHFAGFGARPRRAPRAGQQCWTVEREGHQQIGGGIPYGAPPAFRSQRLITMARRR